MSHNTMPVHLRSAKGVPVLVSERAADLLGVTPPGWQVMTRGSAKTIADWCEQHGQADRSNPMQPGARIALQGLARQIRSRLAKTKGAA